MAKSRVSRVLPRWRVPPRVLPRWRVPPRVLLQVQNQVICEHGVIAQAHVGDRAAVLVHFSDSPVVSRSFRALVREFAEAAYLPVVVSASTTPGPLDWGTGLPPQAIVLRKPNVGYDFGSWAVGLAMLPEIAAAEHVILANDSLVGPFASLRPLLDQFENTGADVWGLTDTHQYRYHLQSYFLGFRGGVLRDKSLARFWTNIRDEKSKWSIIRRNELALSQLLIAQGYSLTAAYRADDLVQRGENPVIRGWWKLLERGYPFVKREIVRDPSVAPHSDRVAHEVYARFGVKLDEWL